MTSFFTGWQLWERMVFVLGCALVLVILLGCLKLTYTHWRLRRLGPIAEKKRQEQILRRQMSEKRRPPGTGREGEVPFGVRAIESGIEVEGVWISRDNSPEPTSSLDGFKAPSVLHGSDVMPAHDLDLEKQSSAESNSSLSGPNILGPLGNTLPIVPSAVEQISTRTTSREPSREPSLEPTLTKPSNQSTHPPSSFTRFSNTQEPLRKSQAASRLDNSVTLYRALTSVHALDRGNDCSNGVDNSPPSKGSNKTMTVSTSAPMLLHTSTGGGKDQSVDATLLNNRRISQAAETGQLTPRARRPVTSGDWTGTTTADPVVQPERRVNISSRSRSASPSGSRLESLPPNIRKLSMPNVTPFAEFVQTAPPSPAASSVVSSMSDRNDANWTSTDLHRTSSPASSYATAAPQPHALDNVEAQPKRSSFERHNRRESQVLRGHGTGFEILQPGSLRPALPVEHPMERQRALPPVSLTNFTKTRSVSVSSSGSGRKLQKKHRDSVDSATSLSSGRKSRNSSI